MESYLDCQDSQPFCEIYFNNITMKNNTYYFLWNQTKCITSQHICQQQQSFLPSTEEEDICLMQPFVRFITQIATVFIISDEYRCRMLDGNPPSENSRPFLITSQLSYFPSITSNIISPEQTNKFYDNYISLEERIYGRTDWYCNRGIVIFYKSNKTKKCLCLPSYFGSRCQWQNQRISLTLQFIYHSSIYLISIFQILIMIVDQQREISSYHEQIKYVPKRDCNTKFNLYLLYPDQPKNSSTNYSIHIDIYNKTDLTYWGIDTRYSLYYSNNRQESNRVFDCLYAYLKDKLIDTDAPYTVNYQLIPYCRRLDENEEQDKLSNELHENIENIITFAELYRQCVTSKQLLDWYVPIDIAEQYEIDGKYSNELFYNCSSLWFGSMCEYTFDINITFSFNYIVETIFDNRRLTTEDKFSSIIGTCYRFLTGCNRGLSSLCLDWREICDGNYDCINGEDEEFCYLLEINECSHNEYRCHYGAQCIPLAFMRDGMYSTDCLDGTDEKDFQYAIEGVRNPCVTTPIFRCEERTIRYPWRFSCGDGEFLVLDIPQFSQRCHNLRDVPMSSSIFTSLDHISELNCRQALYCLLRINEIFSGSETASGTHCESLIDHCSSKWVVLPEYPIIYRFFQFIYLTNRSINGFKTNLLPDFICFNSSRCPALIYCSVDIGIQNGLDCCKTINLINETLDDWYFIDVMFRNLIQRCSTIDESFSACQLNDSKRFICSSEPNKCLSIGALENGKTDCLDGEDELTSDERNAFHGLIPFGLICNGIYDFLSVKYLSDIDETHCDW
ncbi:unnamed protein product [Adineta steineri]|uniref:EGF-like domain-containing protein n=1 Tax=Adineta steineri TaxID=433720 RepID=A0A814QW03_9BILA|nr:unnamed protein product [Adineta steineri]